MFSYANDVLNKIRGSKKPVNKDAVDVLKFEHSLTKQLSKIITLLVSIIEKENKLLALSRISEVKDMSKAKLDVLDKFNDIQITVENYVNQGGKFHIQNPDFIKLQLLFRHLDKISNKNEVLITSNMQIIDQMITIYKQNQARATLRQFGYNEDGKIISANNVEAVMPSIGLNNKV